MINPVSSILLSLLFVCAAQTVCADPLHGFIERHSGQRFLRVANDDETESVLAISTVTPELQTNLNKLKDGDFIVARGSVSVDGQSVQIQSIESLGLAALVGTWMNERFDVYEFQDFSQLNLYVHADGQDQVVKAGEFHYAVTPEQGSRYSIFLSNDQSVTIGSIQFKKARLKLTLIDPQTGSVTSEMTLSPFATSLPLK